MHNTILYLIAYAGTGKYTIAKEIAALTGAIVVDNQLINNPIFSVIGADGKTALPAVAWDKIENIRRTVLDTIMELSKPEASFIFTNELCEGDLDDRRWYEEVVTLANKRRAILIPVFLHCESEELCRRIASSERAARYKETSADHVYDKISNKVLLRVDHPNLLELEITNLPPADAARAIITHTENKV